MGRDREDRVKVRGGRKGGSEGRAGMREEREEEQKAQPHNYDQCESNRSLNSTPHLYSILTSLEVLGSLVTAMMGHRGRNLEIT